MSELRAAARQALEAMNKATRFTHGPEFVGLNQAIIDLNGALKQTEIELLLTVTPAQIAHANAVERTLTDEVIGDLWYASGGFPHQFARAVERYLKGEE